ncbi:MAG: DUF2207 domain-containing protein [Desulfobacterales bacterium CG07_land_8_20_14_0_80_52_14]|nr:MAG: hypothetical protein COX20_06370 [Desulfobacterales bacterium CG23_combo_of_CG06-09_8_20_14_all_52_9]PIU50102.1 MAG: DUF2207 domain-containing protein [Desulfobacterales bacterium CG07_land_8_20_14_0_80_52_14]
MYKKAVMVFLGIAISLVMTLCPAFSDEVERITDFNSRIIVHSDASLTVTETIRVYCAGAEIKRGIVRDFPTRYKGRAGETVTVPFQIVSIQRDGKSEPYHVETVSNGKKIFIGHKDVFLNPGYYTYAITYQTGRQLGFFENYDELYWNVTGNAWTFVIEKTEALIEIPRGGNILQRSAYTGPQGARGKDFVIDSETDATLRFSTTRPLRPGEGFTVALAWPKGLVAEPTTSEKAGNFLGDNVLLIISLGGMVLLLAYYVAAWFKVGRDPEKGTIIPLFEPPKDFTPAAARYVMQMGYDDKTLASAIVNIAVKGYLKIVEEKKKEFSLVRTGKDGSVLSSREKKIADHLFASSDTIELKNKNHARIGKAVTAFKSGLKFDFEKTYFVKNRGYFIPGAVITLITLIGMALSSLDNPGALFMGPWLTVWTIGCTALFFSVKKSWKAALSGGIASKGGAIFMTLFAVPFFIGEIVGIGLFAFQTSLRAVIALVTMALLNLLFYHLLKAPTLLGRKIMDQIEGFKQYLSVAEAPRFRVLNPPEKTPELFEKYLPYALALDVEHEWSEQFSDVLARAGTEGQAYSPIWYSGRSWSDLGTSGFASSLGSVFSEAIASSATAPGSSSGSGGGGSSGGGGGGGGGSGW